ncbi:MAG: helix-turn-helix domain-containing protein [Roseburia sp.]|nr:helix-turn-helix domain-containing protein [Roseburia sp.]
MQKYDNLGQVFKNLRTNRRISLKQISNEAVSVSQLSRFERGESDLSIGKLLIALENMNVEVSEFIDAVNNNQQTEQIRFMSALIPLEYKRDVNGFMKMRDEEEQKFKENPDVYRYHLNTILLQSFICKCDSSIPFPREYIDQVAEYLFITEDWNMYELILIGNLYLFIDIPLLHTMGQEILKRKSYYDEIGSHRNLVAITLLNIWETCLHRDNFEIASFYMEKTKDLIEDETDLYKRTIYLFLKGLQHYKSGLVLEGIDEMKRAIQIFEWVGSENLANNYKKDFERFVR